jgi:ABC-type microcin C transport system duplicated ATPase subunit YejF
VPTDAPLLEVSGLTVEFRAGSRGWVPVVDDVSLSIAAGEIVGLVGESGSGKTVTGLSMLGLLPKGIARIAGGQVRFDGRDLTALSRRDLEDVRGNDIAMIFQEPMTSLNPAWSIGEQIAESVRRHQGLGFGRHDVGRRRCSPRSASRTRTAGRTSTPTSSPAACGNGS